jgi:glucose/mannose transport system substrate-binding protein
MKTINRRTFLTSSASAAILASLGIKSSALAQSAKPRLTLITQWYHGGDAVAIGALGKYFESKGGDWVHTAVPGFTTDMMNKLRAQIISGDPPAISQLKGPEIAAWSTLAPTVNLNNLVAEAKFAAAVAPDLAKQQMPNGDWIALPLQIHRVNTMWISKKAMDKIGETTFPKTWSEFDALAEKMKAAGIVPVANGGRRDDDGIKFDVSLAGTSPETYRKAIMSLDKGALTSPEMVQSFTRLRKIANWLTPNVGSTDWVDYIGAFIKGEKGILFQGAWAQSFIASQGFSASDYLVGPAPQQEGVSAFVLNSDSFIFWKRDEADLQAGQTLFANILMSEEGQKIFPKVSGAIPARFYIDLSGPDWSDGQRNMVSSLGAAKEANRVLLTLSQNMAQTNDITAAMMDVITEYVHDSSISAEDGAQRLGKSVA